MKKEEGQGSVNIHSISNVTGSQINIAGGNMKLQNQTLQASGNKSELVQQFEDIYQKIDKKRIRQDDKADLKNDVKEIQQENEKGDEADESFLMRRMRNIRRMAPDIFEVILSTFTSPIAGISTVARKVAEKMRAEVH